MRKTISPLVVVFVISFLAPQHSPAQSTADRGGLALSQRPLASKAIGKLDVVVKLADAPLVQANGANYKKTGGLLSHGQQITYVRNLNDKQNALLAQIRQLGGVETGRLTKALNAVVVSIDAAKLNDLAGLSGVVSVRPVVHHQLDLSETVPYIGAAAVQAAGVDGTGVRVAVIDSGIDYTHRNLGGSGTLAAYEAAHGTGATNDLRHQTLDGLFPTAKVVGGYDFVGEIWPFGGRSEDPDPIDFQGHGTHVADIIGGRSLDGLHKGVAPGCSLLAIRACSAVSSSCNGLSLLKAMDFALDPNNDGDISDAVDVINLSLGSSYGQKEDDLSEACANAVRAGVVVVCAAGNSADRPYILGSPSSTPEVISVAQTQVPSALKYPLNVNSPASIAGTYGNTETVGWAPIGAGFTGDVVFVGRGCPGDTYLETNVAGKVVLIDRGTCAVSLKVDRAAKAGAIGVLIGLVAPGDPISFGFGGGTTFVPTLVITKADADLIKANIGAPVNVTVSPAQTTPLVQSMVSSSARGPSYSFNAIKPDIGAPGASVSAEVGTGAGETAFGGTSGAAPMVSGAAALLLQAYPNRNPAEIKALMMNTAEVNIQTDPAKQPGVLAPITRIGGGEVRVDRAVHSTTAAWDVDAQSGSLSFGYQAVNQPTSIKKRVNIRNYSNRPRTYSITPAFRYADDAASGAVTLSAPGNVSVAANGSRIFEVELTVDSSKLPTWNLNGGSQGGNGALLQGVEFDGYLNIADASDNIHLAWQILPHKAAAVTAEPLSVNLTSANHNLLLKNTTGARSGRVEVFSLTGSSPRINQRFLPGTGDNFAVVDMRYVGVRQNGSTLQFAVNTFGERSHPVYPAEFDIYIDVDRDGFYDFVLYNSELNGFAATGQTIVNVLNLNTFGGAAFFFADADLDSANVIMSAPMSALGLTSSSKFDFAVLAGDNYFTGNITDAIVGMTYSPGTPRFIGTGVPATGVPAGGSSVLTLQAVPGGDAASPSQTGLLLLYRDAKPKAEADAITVIP